MKEKILNALKQIEAEHDCRILFAVESGSRAWGFASPDSDYDVRAVYVKPLDWYLGLEERQSDTINAMLPDDIDVAAWELRKALRQLLKSNASFMEWLGSPIVYHDCGLIAQLREMESRTVNPIAIAHHYASMLRHALDDRADDGTIGIKKLCYALRTGLCMRWVMAHETMPPTAFADVRRGLDQGREVDDAIDHLLAIKENAREKERTIPASALLPLIEDCLGTLDRHAWRKPDNDMASARADLERIFRSYVCA